MKNLLTISLFLLGLTPFIVYGNDYASDTLSVEATVVSLDTVVEFCIISQWTETYCDDPIIVEYVEDMDPDDLKAIESLVETFEVPVRTYER